MSFNPTELLGREWTTLQHDCERYEHGAMWIKLSAAALFALSIVFGLDTAVTALLMAVLWLQEAILRTSQSRLGARLMRVEAWLREAEPPAGIACQLYTEWTAMRQGTGALLTEYLGNAVRPTVAFPYAVLLAAALALAVTATTPQ